jgi:hypothetical protein
MAGKNIIEALNPRLDADMARFLELQEQLSKGPSVLDRFATAATTHRGADGQIVSTYSQVYAAEQQALRNEARQLAASLQNRPPSGQQMPQQAMEHTRTDQALGKLGKALGYGALVLATPFVAPAIALPLRLLKGSIGIPTTDEYMAEGLIKSLALNEQVAALQARSRETNFQEKTARPYLPFLIEEHNFLMASVDPEKLSELTLRPLETELTRHFSISTAQTRITQQVVQSLSAQTNQVSRQQNLQMAAAALTDQLVNGKIHHTIASMGNELKRTITPKKGRDRGIQIEGQLLLNIPPRALAVHALLSGNLAEIPRALASKFIKNEAGQSGLTVAITREPYSNGNYQLMEGGFATQDRKTPLGAQPEWDESTFWSLISNTGPGRLIQRLAGIDTKKESLEVGYITLVNPQRSDDDLRIPMTVRLDGRSSAGGVKVILEALEATQKITQLVNGLEGRKPLPRPEVERLALNAARQTIYEHGARPDIVLVESITRAQRMQHQDAIHRAQTEPLRQYGRELRLNQERAAIGEEIGYINTQLQTEPDRDKRDLLRATKAAHQSRIQELDDLLARGGNPTDANGQ